MNVVRQNHPLPPSPAPGVALEPYPLVAVASDELHACGFRAWCLLWAIDAAGTGHLPWGEAVSGLRARGVSRATAYRWLAAVCAGPFGRRAVSRYGDVVVVLAGRARLLAALGPPPPAADARHADAWVTLDLAELAKPTFRREFYRAAAAVHNGAPIARATKKRIYGRSASTQRRAEVGAVVRENYVAHDVHPHRLRPRAQPKRNVFPRGGGCVEQIPSSVTIPRAVKRRPRHSPTTGASPGGGNSGHHRRRYHAPDRLAAGRRPPRPWCNGPVSDVVAGGGDALVSAGGARIRGRAATLWRAVR